MTNMRPIVIFTLALACLPAAAQTPRQYILTLEDCHQMALGQSKELEKARIEEEMVGYDRMIALANCFPKVSATGAYIYNNRDISLVNEEQSERLRNMGTTLDNNVWNALEEQMGVISNETLRKYAVQLLQDMRTSPGRVDVATPVNAIGAEIDASLHPDLHNLMGGTLVVEQPLFTGGKILYSNQMAALAEDLAASKYDMQEAQLLLDVDQAYWQIISIAGKKKLAEAYAELLHNMEEDVNRAIAAGFSTESDALQVRVKANEAEMMLTKATNGLTLAKMLLCQRIGLPLDADITLADESLEVIPQPLTQTERKMEDIYAARPETRSLEIATKIYEKKAKVVRADMLPTVAAVGAFTVTNPNLYNGFQHNWQGGNLSAGVLVKIPICHGGENLFKYRKAKAEARQYQNQLESTRELINLQVTQQRKLLGEAIKKLELASANLDSAEENLCTANIGYEAGVIPTNTLLAAHTAWLSAHSEQIDAGIELQMAAARLRKAEGR